MNDEIPGQTEKGTKKKATVVTRNEGAGSTKTTRMGSNKEECKGNPVFPALLAVGKKRTKMGNRKRDASDE